MNKIVGFIVLLAFFKLRYFNDNYLCEVWYITFINSNILKKKTPCLKTLQTQNKVTHTQMIFLQKCGHERKKKLQKIDQTLTRWTLNHKFHTVTETAAVWCTQFTTLWKQIFPLGVCWNKSAKHFQGLSTLLPQVFSPVLHWSLVFALIQCGYKVITEIPNWQQKQYSTQGNK